MSRRPIRERVRSELPYVLFILAGLVCIVIIALSAVGRQGIGWLAGADLQSDLLPANYDVQPQDTLPPVDATRLAQFQATDEAALTITPDPGVIVTVPVVQITPGPTIIAQVTPTPTSTAKPTHTPAPMQTPLPSPTSTRTPIPTLTPTPIPPPPTNTLPPPDTDTPIPAPTSTSAPSPLPPTDTPPPPPTDTPSPTITPSPTDTPSPTINPPPPPPLSLTVVNTSTTLISLIWSNESASDADFVQYRIYRGTTSGGPYAPAGTTTTTSFVDSVPASGTPYFYVVQGEDTIQASANSPEASGVPGPIGNPNPNPIDCPGPTSPPDCDQAGGPPNGIFSSVGPTQTLILDLGLGNGILNGPLWDFVYYEREADPIPSGIIQMDWVTVELSIDQSVWYVAFVWNYGNESLAQNSNVRDYAITGGCNGGCPPPNNSFCDLLPGAGANEPIPMEPQGGSGSPCPSALGLYGTLPYQTGIAIDINGVIPPPTGEGYRYIRIRGIDPAQPAEIDGIQRLN